MLASAGVVLAQTTTDSADLTGWYIGIAIGVVVVLVVVAIAALLLRFAAQIRRQAGMATAALDAAQVNTASLWEVATTNRTAKAVLEGAIRAREAVEQQ